MAAVTADGREVEMNNAPVDFDGDVEMINGTEDADMTVSQSALLVVPAPAAGQGYVPPTIGHGEASFESRTRGDKRSRAGSTTSSHSDSSSDSRTTSSHSDSSSDSSTTSSHSDLTSRTDSDVDSDELSSDESEATTSSSSDDEAAMTAHVRKSAAAVRARKRRKYSQSQTLQRAVAGRHAVSARAVTVPYAGSDSSTSSQGSDSGIHCTP